MYYQSQIKTLPNSLLFNLNHNILQISVHPNNVKPKRVHQHTNEKGHHHMDKFLVVIQMVHDVDLIIVHSSDSRIPFI